MENKSIAITLMVNEWNVVLNALGQRPYAEVASIVQSMNDQAKEQLLPPQTTENE